MGDRRASQCPECDEPLENEDECYECGWMKEEEEEEEG
jgi:hypothetical protein